MTSLAGLGEEHCPTSPASTEGDRWDHSSRARRHSVICSSVTTLSKLTAVNRIARSKKPVAGNALPLLAENGRTGLARKIINKAREMCDPVPKGGNRHAAFQVSAYIFALPLIGVGCQVSPKPTAA